MKKVLLMLMIALAFVGTVFAHGGWHGGWHHGSCWYRGGWHHGWHGGGWYRHGYHSRGFWPGFAGGVVGGLVGSALTRPYYGGYYSSPTVVVQQPATVVVQQPTVVQQPVVAQQPVVQSSAPTHVWVEGRYVDQIQANGSVVRVWQPGHYEYR